jgi:hypothetical protein
MTGTKYLTRDQNQVVNHRVELRHQNKVDRNRLDHYLGYKEVEGKLLLVKTLEKLEKIKV